MYLLLLSGIRYKFPEHYVLCLCLRNWEPAGFMVSCEKYKMLGCERSFQCFFLNIFSWTKQTVPRFVTLSRAGLLVFSIKRGHTVTDS